MTEQIRVCWGGFSKGNCNMAKYGCHGKAIVNFPEFTQPYSKFCSILLRLRVCFGCCYPTKKGESENSHLLSVHFFLSSRKPSTAPTTAIAATVMPIPGSAYWSARDCGSGVGATVGSGASSTTKAVSACEP